MNQKNHRLLKKTYVEKEKELHHMKQDMIVILDMGATDNPRIARAVRDLGVYSEIYNFDLTGEELKKLPNVKGVIVNGGPNNVVDGVKIDVDPTIYEQEASHYGGRPPCKVRNCSRGLGLRTTKRLRLSSTSSFSMSARQRLTGI